MYVGCPGSGSMSRHRSQPARSLAMIDVWCPSGTCSTTSPSLFSPPVSSWSTSQAVQPLPVQASQTEWRAPRVDAHPGHGAAHPERDRARRDGFREPDEQRVAGHRGRGERAGSPGRSSSAGVWSTGSCPTRAAPVRANEHGTMLSSRAVEKTTGSWTSVRGVATCVSVRTRTGCGWGADSQNVTRPRAGDGGRSSTPMSSRNLT